MPISQFFEDVLGANLSNSRWSWGAFNPITNQYFLRVWEDQVSKYKGVKRVVLLDKKRITRSSGFPERKRHVGALLEGAEGFGVVCVARDPESKNQRRIRSFNESELVRFGALTERQNKVYGEITEWVSVRDLSRAQTGHSTVVPDVKAILRGRESATTKERFANARLGQGQFRKDVLGMWGGCCCLSGSRLADIIRASHIKPWKDSSDIERLDPSNGLPLIATFDALFDAGLMTFDKVGEVLISSQVQAEELSRLKLNALRMIRKPSKESVKYISYHRENIFLG